MVASVKIAAVFKTGVREVPLFTAAAAVDGIDGIDAIISAGVLVACSYFRRSWRLSLERPSLSTRTHRRDRLSSALVILPGSQRWTWI